MIRLIWKLYNKNISIIFKQALNIFIFLFVVDSFAAVNDSIRIMGWPKDAFTMEPAINGTQVDMLRDDSYYSLMLCISVSTLFLFYALRVSLKLRWVGEFMQSYKVPVELRNADIRYYKLTDL